MHKTLYRKTKLLTALHTVYQDTRMLRPKYGRYFVRYLLTQKSRVHNLHYNCIYFQAGECFTPAHEYSNATALPSRLVLQ